MGLSKATLIGIALGGVRGGARQWSNEPTGEYGSQAVGLRRQDAMGKGSERWMDFVILAVSGGLTTLGTALALWVLSQL